MGKNSCNKHKNKLDVTGHILCTKCTQRQHIYSKSKQSKVKESKLMYKCADCEMKMSTIVKVTNFKKGER